MTTTTRTTALTGALIAIGLLTACSSDNEQTPAGNPSAGVAPQTDARELSDWAATTFLTKESTDICEVGTNSLVTTFAENGWCEQDVAFTETPMKLTLAGACDTREQGDPVAAGDLYLYIVEPSIEFTDGAGTDNAVIVIVNDDDGSWQVADLYAKDTDPEDPKAGACPFEGLQLLDESVSLG